MQVVKTVIEPGRVGVGATCRIQEPRIEGPTSESDAALIFTKLVSILFVIVLSKSCAIYLSPIIRLLP